MNTISNENQEHKESGANRHYDGRFMLGPVEVRPDSLGLVVDGAFRRIEPRVMDLLVYGSERSGQLLGRDQIFEEVWGNKHLVPEALQRAVSLLRKALGDSPDRPRYIETVSSRGYRFLLQPQPVEDEELPPVKLTEKSVHTSPLVLITAAVLLVLLAWWFLGERGGRESPAPPAAEAPQASEPAAAPRSDPGGD